MSPIPEGGEVTYTWGRRCHLYLREERSPIPEGGEVTYT
jgi:hypothetical protein